MRRYLVFAGGDYYPSGGWDDYVGHADTVEAALRLLAPSDATKYETNDWYHIVDTNDLSVIERS